MKYTTTFKSGDSGRVTHCSFENHDTIKDARRWLRINHYVPESGDAVRDEKEVWIRDIVKSGECSEGDCDSPYAEIVNTAN